MISNMPLSSFGYFIHHISYLDRKQNVNQPVEKIINDPEDDLISLQKNIFRLPVDMQVEILKNATNIQDYLKIRLFIDNPKVIENHAQFCLKQQNLSITVIDKLWGVTAEEKYLSNLFNKIINNAAPAEIDKIIQIKRNLLPFTHRTKRKLETIIEKIQEVASRIMADPTFRFIMGGILSLYLFIQVQKIMKVVENIFVTQLLPVFLMIATRLAPAKTEFIIQRGCQLLNPARVFYKNHENLLLFGTFFIACLADHQRIARYPRIRSACKNIHQIVWLPYRISTYIFNFSHQLSKQFYHKFSDTSLSTSHVLKNIKEGSEKQRVFNELQEARCIWIDRIKSRKIINKAS